MDIEELHAALPPVRHFFQCRKRSRDFSGCTYLVDSNGDLLHHHLRARLAEWRRGRIAHVLRKIAVADEEEVDTLDRQHLVQSIDRIDGLDHGDDQPLFISGTGIIDQNIDATDGLAERLDRVEDRIA